MPIKGLTENRRLPRLGKIHLGVKQANARGVEYPKAVDYFVCPTEVQGVFGEQPRELRILLPAEDPERWASQYYRYYSQSRGLICKGDGETAMAMVDTETGEIAGKDSPAVVMREIECRGRECALYGGHCKEVMNLQFLLPEVPGLGVWQIDTGSINSIRNINSAAELIRLIHGRISMIPLLLTLEPQGVQDPSGKKKTIHVLNLRTRSTLTQMMEAAEKPLALLSGEAAELFDNGEEPQLPVPDDETPELIIPESQQQPTLSRGQKMATIATALKGQGKKTQAAEKVWAEQAIASYTQLTDCSDEEIDALFGLAQSETP